jgi:hypothetical protein
MSRSQPGRELRDPYAREFAKLLPTIDTSRRTWELFVDWTVLASSSIYNGLARDPVVEEEYLHVARRYDAAALAGFAKLIALTVESLEEGPSDFLGSVYESAGVANESWGQFFTPFDVSRFIAGLNVEGLETLPPGRILTVNEPACGAGGMVIALLEAFGAAGFDWQNCVFIVAQDVDETCFRMAYIQRALLGASAIVIQGDTLAFETRRAWATPMYYLTGMEARLRAQRALEALQDLSRVSSPGPVPDPDAPQLVIELVPQGESVQLDLFASREA